MLGARLAGASWRWAWPRAREGIVRATGRFQGVEGGGRSGYRVEVTSSSRWGKLYPPRTAATTTRSPVPIYATVSWLMLRPAGQPVHDTLLPGEHRVSPCSFTSTSVLYLATVFDAEIVRAAAANPRLFTRVASPRGKKCPLRGGKEGARSGRGWGGMWRGRREGGKCWRVREGCAVQFPRARDVIWSSENVAGIIYRVGDRELANPATYGGCVYVRTRFYAHTVLKVRNWGPVTWSPVRGEYLLIGILPRFD